MSIIKKSTLKNQNIKVIFCDFFDTLVHRNVHPNYVYKIWAKNIVKELGLDISINMLYQIRIESLSYTSKKQNKREIEVSYKYVITEVYKRLLNNNIFFNPISLEDFIALSSEADYTAEILVQFTNTPLISQLREIKKQGLDIFLVSDFYLPKSIFLKILRFHKIDDIFKDIYISCSQGKSKEEGGLFAEVLKETNFSPSSVLMVGDNKKSDIINSSKYGILGEHLKHSKHQLRNKINILGSDTNDFNKVLKNIEKKCKKSDFPYSQFIIFFTIFTKRLYKEARRKNINNIFFLAREGHYLKKLFDYYQFENFKSTEPKINTHYFKISRQSAMQFALKELHEENFTYLEEKYGDMSVTMFLKNFLFSEKKIADIISETGLDENNVIHKFVKSDSMTTLRDSSFFKKYYEENRILQKKYFNEYLNSFNVDIAKEGMTIVDVGWGGSMQQWLHEFFNKKISVTGYYIGLKEIYDIKEKTKRFGLNFSIYPNTTYSDTLLTANSQLYEQLLSAPHGSTLGYASKEHNYTIEHHQKDEKYAYENYFKHSQEYMFSVYKELLEKLKPICYEDNIVQKNMSDLTLRTGLLAKSKNLKFINNISKGFYQNIGNGEIGIVYKMDKINMSKTQLIKQFIVFPEKTVRYLVKVRPFLYSKGYKLLSRLTYPLLYFVYCYVKINNRIRNHFLNKNLL